MLNIRQATRADAGTIASLVRELADYEKLLDDAKAGPADFLRELETPTPVIHVLIADWNGESSQSIVPMYGRWVSIDGSFGNAKNQKYSCTSSGVFRKISM